LISQKDCEKFYLAKRGDKILKLKERVKSKPAINLSELIRTNLERQKLITNPIRYELPTPDQVTRPISGQVKNKFYFPKGKNRPQSAANKLKNKHINPP
jgi:hypothetical protein